MKLYTYLNYGGNCRQAFEFYEEHLGGKITSVKTHGEQAESNNVPLPRQRDQPAARSRRLQRDRPWEKGRGLSLGERLGRAH